MTQPAGFDAHRPPDPALLDDCVHCGLCLPACPTYLLWGQEMDSPRGRLHLMKQASQGAALGPALGGHIDACLGCLACQTACPSGVRYGQLLEASRAQLERRLPRAAGARLLRSLLFAVLPRPRRLALLGRLLAASRAIGLLGLLRGALLARLPAGVGALLSLLPEPRPRHRLARATPAEGGERRRVALLEGCVQGVFFSHVNAATVRVLAAEGCAVAVPERQGCCGALSLHAGREEEARELARRTVEAFERFPEQAVVANAAGCGSALKDYGRLLADDPRFAERGRRFAARVRDFAELLDELGPRAPRRPLAARVAYQDACHLSHAQGIRRQPRALLAAIPGLEIVELAEPDLCCGSAGVYNILQPEAGRALGDRKAREVLASGAAAVVSANPGCLLQLRAGLERAGERLPLLHLAELLDASLRGERLG